MLLYDSTVSLVTWLQKLCHSSRNCHFNKSNINLNYFFNNTQIKNNKNKYLLLFFDSPFFSDFFYLTNFLSLQFLSYFD